MLLSFAFWGYYTKLFCKKNGKVCTFYEKNVNVNGICMCETAKIRLGARKTVAKYSILCYHSPYSFIPLKSAGSFWETAGRGTLEKPVSTGCRRCKAGAESLRQKDRGNMKCVLQARFLPELLKGAAFFCRLAVMRRNRKRGI